MDYLLNLQCADTSNYPHSLKVNDQGMLIVNVGMLTIQVGADGDFIGSFGHIPFTVESATVTISTSTASTFANDNQTSSAATGNWDTKPI